jgi:hypothetical protein
MNDRPLSDHAAAAAQMLEHYARLIREGKSPTDLGPEIVLFARVLAHRT